MTTSPDDVRDAEAILAVLKAVLPHWDRRESACRGLLRNSLEKFWDAPRSTMQGHRLRDHKAVWSPAALGIARRARADEIRSGKKPSALWKTLVGEHVIPVKVQTARLVEVAATDPEIEEVIEVVQGKVAIVSPEEDAALRAAGLQSDMPEGWEWGMDEWARYRAAGLDPDAYVPWPGEPTRESLEIEDEAADYSAP